jgi:hypothetical protein
VVCLFCQCSFCHIHTRNAIDAKHHLLWISFQPIYHEWTPKSVFTFEDGPNVITIPYKFEPFWNAIHIWDIHRTKRYFLFVWMTATLGINNWVNETLGITSEQNITSRVTNFTLEYLSHKLLPMFRSNYHKEKAKSLSLIKHHATKTLENGGIASHILNLGTRQRWRVRFTLWPLYSPGKSSWFPLELRLGGPESQSGHCGDKKNLLPLPGIEPQFIGCPDVGHHCTNWAISATKLP